MGVPGFISCNMSLFFPKYIYAFQMGEAQNLIDLNALIESLSQ